MHLEGDLIMKFRFDPNLDFQTRAIESVVQLFDGATRLETGFELIAEDGVISNDLTLTEGDLLENLRAVQGDEELQGGAAIPAAKSLNSLDFSIEMETGTGKTDVYLRTAFELHKKHGFRKFIIVVPSVAIRKGVIKTFEMTKDHFGQIYDHLPYRFYEYDSANLSRVRQFTSSNDVEFMIMTLASFDKAINVFNRSQDRMMGRSPLELVQNARPILILDEPQNMEGPRVKRLSKASTRCSSCGTRRRTGSSTTSSTASPPSTPTVRGSSRRLKSLLSSKTTMPTAPMSSARALKPRRRSSAQS